MEVTGSKDKGGGRHPADAFEREMEDLERSPIRSWSSWLAAVGAVTLLAGIVLIVLAYETRHYRAPAVAGNLATVTLLEPQGELDHLPASFSWQAVSGADTYLVTVEHADLEDVPPLILRPARGTRLSATREELLGFRSGSYRWTVEARGFDGKPRAFGDGEFILKEPVDMP